MAISSGVWLTILLTIFSSGTAAYVTVEDRKGRLKTATNAQTKRKTPKALPVGFRRAMGLNLQDLRMFLTLSTCFVWSLPHFAQNWCRVFQLFDDFKRFTAELLHE